MSKCRYDVSEDCHNKDCLECVLDKIRAEIVELREDYHEFGWAYDDALDIIDKYRVKVGNKE